MATILTSKIGNYSVHIFEKWTAKNACYEYHVIERNKYCSTERAAIRVGRNYLKRKRIAFKNGEIEPMPKLRWRKNGRIVYG